MEHDIPFGNSNRETGSIFLDFPLFLGIFQWDAPTKRVPFTAEPEIPEILTKWKRPMSLWPRTIKILIPNLLRARKFSQLFKNTMVTLWSRSTSNFNALIGQNLTGEFMRKIYAAC